LTLVWVDMVSSFEKDEEAKWRKRKKESDTIPRLVPMVVSYFPVSPFSLLPL
jgi:hypothetical protein